MAKFTPTWSARLTTSAGTILHHTGASDPAAHAPPTNTGTTAAGRVRGRAPATQSLHPEGEGVDSGDMLPVSHAGVAGTPATARDERPYDWPVNELVCVDLDCGPAFVDRVRRAWDEGDAVFPVDRRLPPAARATIIRAVAPTVVADESGDASHDGRPVQDGDALVVATSGTTGDPRAAVLTLAAVTASAEASSSRLDVGPDDCWFACLPVSHVGGFSVIARSIIVGTPCIPGARFTPEGYVRAAAEGATLVSLVATALSRVDPSLYRTILLGGARRPEVVPPNVVSTYGMTETGSGVVYDGVPLPGVDVEIRDGIIHLRAPMMMRCYRDGSAPFDEHGWFATGDIGSIDSAGRLHVEGRAGDLIVTGGENVWPEPVEARIALHPAVADCCVAGVPDPEWGRAVHAWVEPRPGATVTLEELKSFVREEMAPWCAPRALHLVDRIPRTSLGKPRRAELVALLAAQ